MKLNKGKVTSILILTSIMITGFGLNNMNSYAMENRICTYDNDTDNVRPDRCFYPGRRGTNFLRESMDDLQENGELTDKDVENINEYMDKERIKRNAQIKEEIYKCQCEKIDDMVSQKVISKEKGEKLKSAVKENVDELEVEMNSIGRENRKENRRGNGGK